MEYTHTHTRRTQTNIKAFRSPEANTRGLGTPQMKKTVQFSCKRFEQNYNTENIL